MRKGSRPNSKQVYEAFWSSSLQGIASTVLGEQLAVPAGAYGSLEGRTVAPKGAAPNAGVELAPKPPPPKLMVMHAQRHAVRFGSLFPLPPCPLACAGKSEVGPSLFITQRAPASQPFSVSFPARYRGWSILDVKSAASGTAPKQTYNNLSLASLRGTSGLKV